MLQVLCSGDTTTNWILFFVASFPQTNIYYNNYVKWLTEEKHNCALLREAFNESVN